MPIRNTPEHQDKVELTSREPDDVARPDATPDWLRDIRAYWAALANDCETQQDACHDSARDMAG